MGQFPDSDVSPFKEETGAFSELADGADEELGSARARARARARRRSGRDDDSEDRRTIRPRSQEFEDDDPFSRPTDDDLDEDESSQKTILNDRLAGWHEASDGLGERRIGEGLRSNWVMVGPTGCLLYTSPSPRDGLLSRMPSSA